MIWGFMPPVSSATLPARRIVFTGKQEVHLEDFELPEPEGDQITVRTEFSLMSTGTENIVFNRHFDPGTHWDTWVKYPFQPGYSSVGTVEKAGAGSFKVGDRVASRYPHQSHAVLAPARCWQIPAAIPFESAPWFSLAKIAFHGAQAADYRLGHSVLVIGAGPIGQMSIRWARAAGAESIVAVDAVPDRLELARRGGATAVISAPIAAAREQILEANRGALPDIVIDSTGNAQVFAAALGLAAQFGKVVVLGDTGQPSDQRLTPDVVIRGVRVVGAHDSHDDEKWHNGTITRLFFSLVASGRISLEGLNTHIFRPTDCVEAYATANRERAKTMGIVFDWRKQ
jgi:2-desacetyl-2-hydroxyethyl bacteriochlorophyllide A dehydrogenase